MKSQKLAGNLQPILKKVSASSQEQSASTQEVVKVSEELAEMAVRLQDITEQFKLNDN